MFVKITLVMIRIIFKEILSYKIHDVLLNEANFFFHLKISHVWRKGIAEYRGKMPSHS
jgi:hypothetical protein